MPVGFALPKPKEKALPLNIGKGSPDTPPASADDAAMPMDDTGGGDIHSFISDALDNLSRFRGEYAEDGDAAKPGISDILNDTTTGADGDTGKVALIDEITSKLQELQALCEVEGSDTTDTVGGGGNEGSAGAAPY